MNYNKVKKAILKTMEDGKPRELKGILKKVMISKQIDVIYTVEAGNNMMSFREFNKDVEKTLKEIL